MAGLIAGSPAPRSRLKRFLASSGLVFGLTLLLFLGTYAVLPQFARANVPLPATCAGFVGVVALPARLSYTLPAGQAAGYSRRARSRWWRPRATGSARRLPARPTS